MRTRTWIVVAGAAAAGLAGGAAWRYWDAIEAPPGGPSTAAATEASAVEGEPRPAFELPDRSGEKRSIAEFDGRVVLVNFWATWCAPCIEEMPMLDALDGALGDRGLRVVGVAIDDAEAVRRFAREHDIGYPLLVGGRDAFSVAAAYGNARGALPYTVVIDRAGVIRETHYGLLDRDEARALVTPYL